MTLRSILVVATLAGCFLAEAASRARSAEIAVANYGSSVSGMPWAVALAKGFFKESGADVTAIIGSNGGSSEVRNLIAGDLPYVDSSLIPMLKAIRGGADLRIVNENSHTTAQFVWIVNPNSPIREIGDIKGRTISFTTPLSTSQSLDYMLVQKASLTPRDVRLVSTGAYGAALTALQNGGVDVALVSEPIYTLNKDKFRVLVWSRDVFPAINSTVGVASASVVKSNPGLIRGIIEAHRKAVAFMSTNRKEASEIVGTTYKMSPAIVEEVLGQLLDHPSIDAVPFYSDGDIFAKGLDAIVDLARKSGDLKEEISWRDHVDQTFLPEDLKRKLN